MSCVVVASSERGRSPAGQVLAVELRHDVGPRAGSPPTSLKRRQAAEAVEGRVIDALGHHRAGDLLEAADEEVALAAAVRLMAALPGEHVTDEVEHVGVNGRVRRFACAAARLTKFRSRSET